MSYTHTVEPFIAGQMCNTPKHWPIYKPPGDLKDTSYPIYPTDLPIAQVPTPYRSTRTAFVRLSTSATKFKNSTVTHSLAFLANVQRERDLQFGFNSQSVHCHGYQ